MLTASSDDGGRAGRAGDGHDAMARCLVTGATGFIGYEVGSQMSDAGLRPRLMARRASRASLLNALDAEVVYGDLARPSSLRHVVQGVDTVIHLGARATFERANLLRPTIVEGSLALARAAAEAGAKHFVYASSMMVYAGDGEWIDASTQARPCIDYGELKLEAEGRLAEIAKDAGMKFAALRLPHVYGARDLLFRQIAGGRIVVPGGDDNLFSHLNVHDCARIIIECARRGWSGVSAVADRRPTTWNEFFEVLDEYYPGCRRLRVPTALARAGASLVEPLLRLRGRPSMTTRDTVDGWNLDFRVSPDLLWEDLGIEPRYATVETGIPAALDECVAFRWRHSLADSRP